MTPEDRATVPAGLQRNKVLSAGAIGFPLPDGPPLHTPTFGRPDLPPGGAWCIGCQRVISLHQFVAGEACPGKEAR